MKELAAALAVATIAVLGWAPVYIVLARAWQDQDRRFAERRRGRWADNMKQ